MPARAPTAGARTASPAFPMTSSSSASRWPCGTARIAILKERLFGLTNSEGNHGEDVKEYYFYLDSTPTHSYMKYLYKYPQAAFPYADLVETNRRRNRNDMEYELLDTGVFNEDRYFDVFVEYAKAGPEDILVRITAANRGPDAAELHLLPTLWFRNDWSSWIAESNRVAEKPNLKQIKAPAGASAVAATHPVLGEFILSCEGEVPLLFTENETNHERLFPGQKNESPYVKDGINDCVVQGNQGAVNPDKQGTKVAAHYQVNVGAGQTQVIRLRLSKTSPDQKGKPFGKQFDEVFADRLREADEFYKSVTPPSVSEDEANVMRQALAGMLWSKQFFFFDGDNWLDEHHSNPLHSGYRNSRNSEWFHMLNKDIISMPDKWEYPWYAAWDLAFHTLPLAIVDPDFAKQQMELMLQGVYLHPSGQLPAYEWNFSDVNPPVHAWATLFLHRTEQALRGETDVDFLKSAFNKLLLNFTWWANRKDRFGKNVFEGGFLGLDNIGVFDRSAPLPTGGRLEQADGTAWMALFSQNMAELAIELAAHDRTYEDMVVEVRRALLLHRRGHEPTWGQRHVGRGGRILLRPAGAPRWQHHAAQGAFDGGAAAPVRHHGDRKVAAGAHSAGDGSDAWSACAGCPSFSRRSTLPARGISAWPSGGSWPWSTRSGSAGSSRRCSTRTSSWAPTASARSRSSTSSIPTSSTCNGQEYRVDYLPAESNTGMFGGNSNWRGPVWMPVNAMIIRALLQFYLYYGDNFKVECPTGSGRMMNLFEVAKEIADRLTGIFLRDEHGRRPVYGGTEKFQSDPHWRDHILFYEYFHGDNGAGLGASHQTGWTGLVAKFIQLFGFLDPKRALEGGQDVGFPKRGRRTLTCASRIIPHFIRSIPASG